MEEQRNNLEGQNGYSDLFKLLQLEPSDSQENRIDIDSVIDHIVNNPDSEHLIEEQQEKMSFCDGDIINLKLLKHSDPIPCSFRRYCEKSCRKSKPKTSRLLFSEV